MSKIRIVIADDQMLTREGLRTILDLEDDMEVVGVARNGLEACELTEALQPDLVLMDIQMPMMDGIAALKRIKRSQPQTYILILTTFVNEDYIVDGMANGASGYMLKDMDADKMIASIRDTVTDQFILPAAVAAKLALHANKLMAVQDSWQNAELRKLPTMKLTERENEIAQLIIQGLNNREIAEFLQIAEGTARNYISNLYGKLEVNDRAQAIIRLHTLV
ncbi:response regulator transcription factor [Paenibacillus sp. RC67]|uniref:response regulator transcription factor n=1 Tax=Paenibacillus sp. RC67 TaxID=3039392 RepID=UPI0024AD42D7|nr:response regulator transcription factor [Paenibacillus sp. RC67]